MSDLPVSVVIVSRGRADVLKRCLLGLSQLQYDRFEVVVVADPAGVQAAQQMPFAAHLKIIAYDVPNISAARNLGLAQAAGEIIAFIDDDAVPEPQWLRHLVAPAVRPEVAAMGGFVRGRNGISYQWKARSLDALGEAHDLAVDPQQPSVLRTPKGRAIKTEGTNMAFRRDVLVALGGFDPAYYYYLDETDLNMRIAQAGHATAIVPLAEVHHGFAANRLRSQTRVPRDLFDIGASWAVFQRKHVAKDARADQWARLRAEERRRVLRHLVGGGLEPASVRRLLRRLDEGHAQGQTRAFGAAHLPAHPAAPFAAFPSQTRESRLMVTRPWRYRQDRAHAAARVKQGEIVTLLSLSPSMLFHHIRFEADGVWTQIGGIYGKSDRESPLFQMISRAGRAQKERLRVATPRGLRNE